jgi:hypothetical protein
VKLYEFLAVTAAEGTWSSLSMSNRPIWPVIITILSNINRPLFYLKHKFHKLHSFSVSTWLFSHEKETFSIGPNCVGSTWGRGENPVSETLCFK